MMLLSKKIGITIISCIFISACTSIKNVENEICPIWDITDESTDGLVNVKSDLFVILRSLAPPNAFNNSKVCWYQTPSGNLEGYPKQKYGYYDIGYEFERDGAGWKFLKRNEYVVLSHPR